MVTHLRYANSALIDSLADKVSAAVSKAADPSAGYALLDAPDYANVGDSLIWLGVLRYFETAVGRRPDYVSTRDSFDADALRRAAPHGPIYLSGGGNFGDIWPRFQAFRHAVLAAFPDRRIVQLPQSIHFSSAEALAATRQAIATHGNFTMLVRDEASLQIARDALACEVALCPDMAFCLGPLDAPAPPRHDVVLLLRTDKERVVGQDALNPPPGLDCAVVDWIAPPAAKSRIERMGDKVRTVVTSQSDYDRFAAAAEARLDIGLAMLGAGRSVITDRLHGHILSVLMGIPHVILDNSYGKIGGFAKAWTAGSETVRAATTLTEAFVALAEFDGRRGPAA